MGGSYSNITLKGPEQSAVAKALHGRAAIVSPKTDSCTVVYDSICDNQDADGMSEHGDRSYHARVQLPGLGG